MQLHSRKSRRLSLDRLETRDLLSISAVVGSEQFVTSSAIVYTGRVVNDKLLLHVLERDKGPNVVMIDIVANELRPLSDFAPADSSLGDLWDGTLFVPNGDDFYFTTFNVSDRHQLWISNGTSDGTTLLHESDTWIAMNPKNANNRYVFFGTNGDTWMTQGTVGTTVRLFDSNTRVVAKLAREDGVSLLTLRETDAAQELWLGDPLVPNSESLVATFPGTNLAVSTEHVTDHNVYFSVTRYPSGVPRESELFVTDLKSGTIEQLISAEAGYRNFGDFTDAGARVLFAAAGIASGAEYWISQGSKGSTLVTSIDSKLDDFIVANDRIYYFSREDNSLWMLEPDATVAVLAWNNPDELRPRNPQVALLGSEVIIRSNRFIIRTDGTPDGTSVLEGRTKQLIELPDRVLAFGNRDRSIEVFEPGKASSQLQLYAKGESLAFLGNAGSAAIAIIESEASDGQIEHRVYTTNGTRAGTFVIGSFKGLVFSDSRVPFLTTAEVGLFGGRLEDTANTIWRVEYDAIADVNDDSRLDAEDVDAIASAIAMGESNAKFDLNADNRVDVEDISSLIQDFAETRPGDINLDRKVDFKDFLIMSANFGRSIDGGWSVGDFNEDNEVNISDFRLLAANFGYDRFSNVR